MSTPETRKEVEYLRSLPSIRARCGQVFERGQKGELRFWDLDLGKEEEIVGFCEGLIERDYKTPAHIPPHSRWRHFLAQDKDRITPLVDSWTSSGTSQLEVARRLVDLFVVSVLLDAGAGNAWRYKEKEGGADIGEGIGRSEGLAVASLDCFKDGLFSGVHGQPYRVDSLGLSKLTPEAISTAMQVSEANPMTGIEGRANLLVRLGYVLSSVENEKYFGSRTGEDGRKGIRPGNLIDYLLNHPSATQIPSAATLPISVRLSTLWDVLMTGLRPVWPSTDRLSLHGQTLGDVWECTALKTSDAKEGEVEEKALVPFHKLTQWLCYSLIEVLEKTLYWKLEGKEHMTGLPEYRNGGLLIDFGLLKPRTKAMLASLPQTPSSVPDIEPELLALPALPASHLAIIEMRAITVIELDRIAEGISDKLGLKGSQRLQLAQVLEGATWKGGREIAKTKRPPGGGPPINILLDGTIF